jgi:hypothetical protein
VFVAHHLWFFLDSEQLNDFWKSQGEFVARHGVTIEVDD